MSSFITIKHFTLTTCALILSSIFFHWDRAMQADVAWLTHGARILLDGGNFFDDFYETNPPLSTILYIPAAYLERLTSLSLPQSTVVYCVILSVFVLSLCYFLAQRIPFFNATEEKRGLTNITFLTLAISILFLCGENLGQRDIVAGFGTYAFCLSQYIITSRIKAPTPLLITAQLVGAISALIKPHWGVFIVIGFAYRAWKQKRYSVIFDRDFLIISLMTAAYAYALFVFYPGYMTFVFPDVLKIYAAAPPQPVHFIVSLVALTIVPTASFWALANEFKFSDQHIKYLKFCFFLTAISTIPVLLQMKGFRYHYAVATSFTIASFTLFAVAAFQSKIRKMTCLKHAFIVPFILLLAFTVFSRQYLDKVEIYTDSKLYKTIQKYAAPDESYFILFENMGLIFPLNQYIERPYGSRFASYWFFTGLLDTGKNDYIQQKYGNLIAEDLGRYKTKVYVIQRIKVFSGQEGTSDDVTPLSFLSGNPIFKEEWQKYTLAETITFPREGINFVHKKGQNEDPNITMDIYVRHAE